MNIENVKIMYFLGIGGIGMSALARYCHSLGIEIHGYDLTPTVLTSQLIEEGMHIHFYEDVSLIPPRTNLVVYTPAVPKSNAEYIYFQKHCYDIVKRSQLLGLLSQSNFTIAVAGTHGKTSICSIISHLLYNSGRNVSSLVGGIMNNGNTNAIISKKTDYLVLEADEFDRSFLWLEPNISVVSSMDDDHLDIYKDTSDISNTFIEFANKTDKNGLLIYQDNLDKLQGIDLNKSTYGTKSSSAVKAEKIRVVDSGFVFDIVYEANRIEDIKLHTPGRHYIENALAATSVVIEIGLTNTEIKVGLETFKGVERRFEFRLITANSIYIDDYAHHPKEISSTLNAVKELYPSKKITVVFQPHLFSRTKDFAEEFANSLDLADEVVLLDIYPARELPMEGVTSKIILDKITLENKSILSKNELIEYIRKGKPEVLVSLGAGDIGLLVNDLQKALTK